MVVGFGVSAGRSIQDRKIFLLIIPGVMIEQRFCHDVYLSLFVN